MIRTSFERSAVSLLLSILATAAIVVVLSFTTYMIRALRFHEFSVFSLFCYLLGSVILMGMLRFGAPQITRLLIKHPPLIAVWREPSKKARGKCLTTLSIGNMLMLVYTISDTHVRADALAHNGAGLFFLWIVFGSVLAPVCFLIGEYMIAKSP